jgi:hypothetical protein
VHLKLETDVEFIDEDPFHDLAWIDPAENGGEEDGVTATR